MRPTFRKLEVKDIGHLERLVADNVEGVEPGLKVVDSRLLLGQAAIDLVGLDSRGSLALIALDFTADEGLLLRVMDAYSWCLEFPDTLRRLYPMAQISTARPPRILFIVERLTDSFLRRIKQLSFLEIDCLEFRHLEVNGESVVFFDHVERLRKGAADSPVETPAPAPVVAPAARVIEPRVEPVREPVRAEVVRPSVIEAPQPVVVPRRVVEPVRPAVAEAIRRIVAEAPQPVAEVVRPAVTEVVKPVEAVRPPVTEAVRPPVAEVVEPAVVEPEVVAAAEPEVEVQAPAAPAFVAPPAAPVVAEQPAVQEYQSVKLAPEPAAVVSAASTVVAPEATDPAPVKLAPVLQLEPIQATASIAVAGTATNGHVPEATPAPVIVTPTEAPTPVAAIQEAEPVSAPVAAAAPVNEPAPEPVVPAEPAVIPAAPVQTPAAPAQTPPVWAKAQAQPNGNRPHFFAQATKSPSPAEAPAPAVAAAPVAAPPAPAQPSPTKTALEVDDRPELESLSFPKDGLSRQWLEFLSQLGATK
jgi:hypothetical protein